MDHVNVKVRPEANPQSNIVAITHFSCKGDACLSPVPRTKGNILPI
jgi:hypothetical protein